MLPSLRHAMLSMFPGDNPRQSQQGTLPEHCDHPPSAMCRSGNAHGSFARCMECNTSWKWYPDREKWFVREGSRASSSRLPLPSSQDSAPAPKAKVQARPKPKAKLPAAKPTLTRPQRGSSRPSTSASSRVQTPAEAFHFSEQEAEVITEEDDTFQVSDVDLMEDDTVNSPIWSDEALEDWDEPDEA